MSQQPGQPAPKVSEANLLTTQNRRVEELIDAIADLGWHIQAGGLVIRPAVGNYRSSPFTIVELRVSDLVG